MELPKQYKACVYDSPGKVSVQIETLDLPGPGPRKVFIYLCVGPLAEPQVL